MQGAKFLFKQTKWQSLALLLVVGLVIASVTTGRALSKKQQQKKAKASVAKTEENMKAGDNELSAWRIIEMTDWLFWPFVALTASGILLITYRTLNEYREYMRSRILLQHRISVSDLRKLVRTVQTTPPNRASRLMHQMIATFNKTNRAEPIGDDINQYLTGERDSFETFNRVLGFLSDTAGALGLLGTVWGIFMTFHGGKLDGPTILQGMSISLVTTLVGLIISLVLNMGATGVFAFFNRHLNMLASRAEELRQALLYLEHKSNNGQRVQTARQQQPQRQPSRPQPSPAEPQFVPAQPETGAYRQPVEAMFPTRQGVLEDDGNGFL